MDQSQGDICFCGGDEEPFSLTYSTDHMVIVGGAATLGSQESGIDSQ